MKKSIFFLICLLIVCVVFNSFSLVGSNAVAELASVFTGIVYIGISIHFFRQRKNKLPDIILGSAMLVASAFAILPLLIYFINAITFVININYNDILFNYFKLYLNSLIGLIIFAIVTFIDFYLEHYKQPTENKHFKTLLFLLLLFICVLTIMIIRRLGYHLSYSRPLTKITLLTSAFLLLPLLLYTGASKNKLFSTFFLTFILTLSNGMAMRNLFSTDFTSTRWFTYTKAVRKASGDPIDTLATINSLKKIEGNFYEITFSGDYTNILEYNNKKCLEESINPGHFCSLFTTFEDTAHYLFARNFDNPQGWKCKTLLCRANPPGAYSSLSLVRLADLGFDVSENLADLSPERKKALVNSVFFSPDGINNKGVVVALASVDSQKLKGDSNKAFINCSYLIREILDHAKDLEEAIAIIKKYNIMNDIWSGTFDQHLLIADASGRSVIAEINDGEFQFISNTTNWQATTNSPSYNVTQADQKKVCGRYKTISNTFESSKGKMNIQGALKMLQSIGHRYTEWSTVYDISRREMTLVIDYDFSKTYHFSLKDSSTVIHPFKIN